VVNILYMTAISGLPRHVPKIFSR